ncbi:MAG: methyltransferase domain-containing protein [Bacteroidetes bacterium]|nr:methyltransferase domain-containing protein [Bacteroidota bacterium]
MNKDQHLQISATLEEVTSTLHQWFSSDEQFNHLYPLPVQALAKRHWTPLHVAYLASKHLAAETGSRILDIGSGVGKFCLAAAYYRPDSFYYGIEQRRPLVRDAETARKILKSTNVSFIHGNFTQIDFKQFDHFYFYNSFYENLASTDKIDYDIQYSEELYDYYSRFLRKRLEQKPAGTKLVTFHSMEDELPSGFELVGSDLSNLLKFWIKI